MVVWLLTVSSKATADRTKTVVNHNISIMILYMYRSESLFLCGLHTRIYKHHTHTHTHTHTHAHTHTRTPYKVSWLYTCTRNSWGVTVMLLHLHFHGNLSTATTPSVLWLLFLPNRSHHPGSCQSADTHVRGGSRSCGQNWISRRHHKHLPKQMGVIL